MEMRESCVQVKCTKRGEQREGIKRGGGDRGCGV